VTLVNQDYISDCIGFGSVLRVTQLRFRVDGNPATSTSETGLVESKIASDDSLPVKAYRRRSRRSLTPSQKEDTPAGNGASTVQQEASTAADSQREQRKPDILDELMQKVKAASDLPLDEPDYEGTLDAAFDVGPSAGASNDSENKSDIKVPEWQKSFTCMKKHDGTSTSNNPNARTIETLQKMADYYDKTADNWRTMAYRKAITALKQQDTKVCTKAQALAIRGIGQRLADKIEEIVTTDHLRRLDNINSTPEDRSLQLFIGVYGARFAQASKWVAQGYRSLDDLKTKADLTANQKIGVERYNDFQQRIPRTEVTLHGNIVRTAIQAIDPDMEVMVAGSYRRGAADCGDIDVLITKNNGTLEYIRDLMIENVVPTLTQKGFLKVSLAATSRGDGSKWHGASALPDTDLWRRIDLLFVPGNEIGAALLYFTGNDIFNRSLRLLARKKGMRLNQRGLYKDVLRGAGQVKVTEGTLLEGQDERRILEILGVPWRPPEHRIC
jgi:DNA polymerase IV